ncbi:MAG: four helix bundle protein [Planctomycetota bacterium]|nr:four helix bundle protein [Planctomycetota bacterium]
MSLNNQEWDNGYAKGFYELAVYQKARDLSRDLFALSKSFPKSEEFSLVSQMRRASRSIGAQIAEAWAKRRYERSFVSKLTDADAEQMETQHWIVVAVDCGFLDREAAKPLFARCRDIGKMLNGMMGQSHSFCGSSGLAQEEASIYPADTFVEEAADPL